ncbi:hypothetical protein [Robinsoniella peoriensis]
MKGLQMQALLLYKNLPGGDEMNLKSKITKLQQALLCKGKVVKIHTYQKYNKEHGRITTFYNVVTPEWNEEKQKMTDKQIIGTSSPIAVVQALLAELKEVGG